jgi:hypothetical protein
MAGKAPTETGVTVHIPIAFRRHGSRKLLVAWSGASAFANSSSRIDSPLVKAVARAFRWRKLIESGTFATISELAEAEKKDVSYVGRILRLTLLGPDIVEAILDGSQNAICTLDTLLKPFPILWSEQAFT